MTKEIDIDKKRQTILIIDDTPTNLGVVSEYLQEYGFEILIARDGESGLKRARYVKPDIILLDVMMPGINGFETCRRLKGDEETRDIPVIFQTSLASAGDKVKGFEAGGVDYVTKPLHQDEVLARITTHLKIKDLTQSLQQANTEILSLNEQLQAENLRMEAELDVAQRLQQLLLPPPEELQKIQGLDVAGFMEPADEVGGDYYDVLQHNGHIKLAMGDVTGHGLESGVLMLMLQTAVRALMISEEQNSVRFLDILNQTLYQNIRRMGVDKTMSLALIDYQPGQLRLSGQHEQLIVLRRDGTVKLQDTIDLGFPLGLEDEIARFVGETTIELQPGDGVVLYSDGITEAENERGEFYGLERLCEVVSQHWAQPTEKIKKAVVTDVRVFRGEQKVYDDLALLVVKQQ